MALKPHENPEGSSRPVDGEKQAVKSSKKDGNDATVSRSRFALLILAAFSAMFLVSLVCCPTADTSLPKH